MIVTLMMPTNIVRSRSLSTFLRIIISGNDRAVTTAIMKARVVPRDNPLLMRA